MSPNRLLLNKLIVGDLSKNNVKDFKGKIKPTEQFVEQVIHLQSKRDLDQTVQNFLADTVQEFALTGQSNLDWLIRELQVKDLNSFHVRILRGLKEKSPASCKNLSSLMDFRAL